MTRSLFQYGLHRLGYSSLFRSLLFSPFFSPYVSLLFILLQSVISTSKEKRIFSVPVYIKWWVFFESYAWYQISLTYYLWSPSLDSGQWGRHEGVVRNLCVIGNWISSCALRESLLLRMLEGAHAGYGTWYQMVKQHGGDQKNICAIWYQQTISWAKYMARILRVHWQKLTIDNDYVWTLQTKNSKVFKICINIKKLRKALSSLDVMSQIDKSEEMDNLNFINLLHKYLLSFNYVAVLMLDVSVISAPQELTKNNRQNRKDQTG